MSLSFKLGTLEPKHSISRLKVLKDENKQNIIKETKICKNENEIPLISLDQIGIHKSRKALYTSYFKLISLF